MIALWTTVLVSGLTAVITVTAHELWYHGRPAEPETEPERPGSDEQWHDLTDAMRRYRKHRTKARRRAN